jgi:hypothetical protein
MEINRNQYFLAGLVLLFLGIQFRLVASFTLNEPTSRVVAKRLTKASTEETSTPRVVLASSTSSSTSTTRQVIRPPKWLGWAFISVGAVLVLHSLAMRRPQ